LPGAIVFTPPEPVPKSVVLNPIFILFLFVTHIFYPSEK
jgi:hypothetical protein